MKIEGYSVRKEKEEGDRGTRQVRKKDKRVGKELIKQKSERKKIKFNIGTCDTY